MIRVRDLVAAAAGTILGLLAQRCWHMYHADPDPQEDIDG